MENIRSAAEHFPDVRVQPGRPLHPTDLVSQPGDSVSLNVGVELQSPNLPPQAFNFAVRRIAQLVRSTATSSRSRASDATADNSRSS